ncbi:PR-1-like protein, partial [Aspergillus steynii IBT 23096]
PISFTLFVLHLFFALGQAQDVVRTTVIVVTVASTATPTVPQPASYTSLDVFKDDVLSASNAYRGAHNATHLVWNETLTAYARDWAEKCKWKHSHGPYGENLAFGYPNASAAIAAWGDEVRHYDFQKPTGFTEETGHFTQLVWKATRQVGCAAVDCGYSEDGEAKDASGRYREAQGWYVVCEYMPPGNVMNAPEASGGQNGLFMVNVQPSSTYSGPSTTESPSDRPATTTATTSGA